MHVRVGVLFHGDLNCQLNSVYCTLIAPYRHLAHLNTRKACCHLCSTMFHVFACLSHNVFCFHCVFRSVLRLPLCVPLCVVSSTVCSIVCGVFHYAFRNVLRLPLCVPQCGASSAVCSTAFCVFHCAFNNMFCLVHCLPLCVPLWLVVSILVAQG